MFNTKQTELMLLAPSAGEHDEYAVGLHCGRHVLTLKRGDKLTDRGIKSTLRKMGFKPVKYKKRVHEVRLNNVLRADDVAIPDGGKYSVLVEFDSKTSVLLRVVIFDTEPYDKYVYLTKPKDYYADPWYWLHTAETLLQQKTNAEIKTDFTIYRDPTSGKYHDFKTVQVRTDKTAYYGANDVDSSLYFQSLLIQSRNFDWFISLQTYSFFSGIEVRFIYS